MPAGEPSDAYGLRSAGPAAGGRPRHRASKPTCRGFRASSTPQRGLPDRARSARTRRSGAIRCAASRAISPSPANTAQRARGAGAGAGEAARSREARIDARRTRAAEQQASARKRSPRPRRAGRRQDHAAYLSRVIGEAVGDDAVIFNEYSLIAGSLPAREARTRSTGSAPPAGSAGASAPRSAPSSPRPRSSWSRRSATAPTCSPTRWSAHWVSDVHKLPILTIIFNNSRYGAVRGATMSMFKDGVAGEDDGRFMADLDPEPGVRGGGEGAGRPWRARREGRRSAGRAGARARRGGQGEAPGAAQRDLPATERTRANNPLDKSRRRLKQAADAWEEQQT